MPEYLAPGVYIEEVSFRNKTIEGVGTSTCAFVGPTRTGPTSGEPELLTSLADFETIYGGMDPLNLDGNLRTNFLAQGVRNFFEEGGRRLYVSRVYKATGSNEARATSSNSAGGATFWLASRFPGSGGNARVTFLPRLGGPMTPNVASPNVFPSLRLGDTVLFSATNGASLLYRAAPGTAAGVLALQDVSGNSVVSLNSPTAITNAFTNAATIQVLTVDVTVERQTLNPNATNTVSWGPPDLFSGFGPDSGHSNALTSYFQQAPPSRLQYLTVPFAISSGSAAAAITSTTRANVNGAALAQAFITLSTITNAASTNPSVAATSRISLAFLSGGSDGSLPGSPDYEGTTLGPPSTSTGLLALESVDDVSIIASPGYSFNYVNNTTSANAITNALITHATKMRYRIAVLDSGDNMAVSEVRAQRAQIDSTYAALYYPWVRTIDPITEDEILLPPSGFVTGIYARNDVDHGVEKAPANEVVQSAVGFEFLLNKGQQEVLNPEGINCFRYFPGRGYRLWGARTVTSDPEWKYVNLRRYFAYLEHSIDKGTQWAVFENNSTPLWKNVQSTIEDFLFNEWKNNRLTGDKPQQAYFVRCDRTTMSQNDIDNGRLVCLIGVAPVRPAEFVIFRIGQWTATTTA